MKLLLCFMIILPLAIAYIDSSEENEREAREQQRLAMLARYRNRKIPDGADLLEGQALIDYVNKKQRLWKAKKHERFASYSDKTKWGIMGVDHIKLSVSGKKNLAPSKDMDLDVPDYFDSRENWPYCTSIKNIRDQSSCGSCWAFGAVEAMSDRICIASRGKIQVTLSADDLLSCCKSCGFGCDGGDPLSAWKYWVKEGIVSGSNFDSHSGCKPYPFPPCEHHSNKTHYSPCKHDLFPTPKCEKECVADFTEKTYGQDKYYGATAFGVKDDENAIMKEILVNGPVEVAFEVYEDFLNYAGGIYIHTGGKLGGGHAVKMIGWGDENGIPYWLVANSWNTDWGENGFFRILRGVDECGIESGVVGGIPKLNRVFPHHRLHKNRHHHRKPKFD